MASKRKSTVPCMIPSKTKHAREEIILGSLPELLPTIPEDSILSISGEKSVHVSNSSSTSESGSNAETLKGGVYSCTGCSFESRDLNYFLDHMHNCHLDFRAQPTFYCLNCSESVTRFEALALHNANSHPKIREGSLTASLSVNKRDGVTTVEQILFASSGEDHKESGISLSKTPIVKMMKAKGEHKRIVVSHTVEVRKIDEGRDLDPSVLTNVPELQPRAPSYSGTTAMPRNAVSHIITTTAADQSFHQHTPSLYSMSSMDPIKDLPKVMIPLSSIPTYDAAMDTSSFLKTSFGKFPYPTKAELCYLTVVSEFPEEQIKLWFTAQRLKQGISWSPEEIEEARRKMFNTVFQGVPPQKLSATPKQGNLMVSHHSIANHPGLKGPNPAIAKALYGQAKGRAVGVITAPSNTLVTRVSYSAPVALAKIPSALQTTQVQCQSTELAGEPDKSNGMDPVGGSSCVCSTASSRSSSISSSYSTSNDADTVTKSVHSCSPVDGTNTFSPAATGNNKDMQCVSDSTNTGAEEPTRSTTTGTNHDNSDNSTAKPTDNEDNDIHKTNHGTNNDCSGSTHSTIPHPNHANDFPTESTGLAIQSNPSSVGESKSNKDFGMRDVSILKQLIRDDAQFVGGKVGSELKSNPVKVNFKRLKRNDPEASSDLAHQEHPSEVEVSACHQTFSPPWSKMTPPQLHILRQAFSTIRWPSSLQYEELSVQTGLPKSEVVRWFSDSRYSDKNGQLKWLENYQQMPDESGEPSGHRETESKANSLAGRKEGAREDKHKEVGSPLGPGVWKDQLSPLLVLTRTEVSDGHAKKSTNPGVGQDAWSERAEEATVNQPTMDPPHDTGRDKEHLKLELLEV